MPNLAPFAAAFGLVLAATPALAETPEQRSVTFSVAAIDLSTPKGQRELNGRINRAVRDVCQTASLTTGSRILPQDAQDCIAKARASAARQVARLMAAESAKGG